jgi:hypothetical protein
MTHARIESVTAMAPPTDDVELQLRVSAEFVEMPGLTITLAQAARLFCVDRSRCERILGYLVRGGVLTTDGRVFARAGTGRRNI